MKWYSYIICTIAILLGMFFGIKFYQELTSTSYTNGSINIENQFSQETFDFRNSAVVFYPTENSEAYSFEIDLVKTNGFDGERKDYTVILNDYILYESNITGGAVKSDVQMDFYDTEGNLMHEAKMSITIRFLSSKTQLILSCPDLTSATYFENYFTNNGIRLLVMENK